MKLTLPTDSAERKNVPVYSGVIKYAPAALAGVARISKQGNDKHNPGKPLHHARGKSTDHADCIVRHVMDVADIEAGLLRGDPGAFTSMKAILDEASQMVWRALMWSQELHERYGDAPLAPGARLPTATVASAFLDSREPYVEGGGHHQGSYAAERAHVPEPTFINTEGPRGKHNAR